MLLFKRLGWDMLLFKLLRCDTLRAAVWTHSCEGCRSILWLLHSIFFYKINLYGLHHLFVLKVPGSFLVFFAPLWSLQQRSDQDIFPDLTNCTPSPHSNPSNWVKAIRTYTHYVNYVQLQRHEYTHICRSYLFAATGCIHMHICNVHMHICTCVYM